MSYSNNVGQEIEQLACQYLTRNGLKLIQKNVRCRLGEIDLIMLDGATVVFVEVRYRQTNSHGGPLESITEHKKNKIFRAAQYYLQTAHLVDKVPVRFDVLAVSGETPRQMTWIKQALDHTNKV